MSAGGRMGLLCCVVGAAVIAGVVLCVLHSDGGRREETPLPTAGGRDGVRTVRIVPSKCPVRSQEDFVASPDVSAAVAVVCGRVDASADRYGLRNDALRSIARRRDLTEGDVAALMAYVASGGGALNPTREAALRNDVLNLLRNQDLIPKSLPDLLMDIVRNGRHDATLVDYAIQHLGALQHGLPDVMAGRVCDALFAAASGIGRPYAGTALYALADAHGLTGAETGRLHHLTCAACSSRAHPLTRLAAFQLAGQRGYREVLSDVRAVLRGDRRDAVADTVAVGTLGLLGDASDIALLESIAARGGSRLTEPCAMAIERISGRIVK